MFQSLKRLLLSLKCRSLMQTNRIEMTTNTKTFKLVSTVNCCKSIFSLCFCNSIKTWCNISSYTFNTLLVVNNVACNLFYWRHFKIIKWITSRLSSTSCWAILCTLWYFRFNMFSLHTWNFTIWINIYRFLNYSLLVFCWRTFK